MRAPDAFEKAQRKLYRAMREELKHLEEAKGPELRSYEKSYQQSLKGEARPARREALLAACANARVVLVGDFHPFRQSQKAFLRLLKEANGASVIALECVQKKFQAALDHFSRGHITAEELREEIEFERHWPFAWESYREIFVFARTHGIPLLALNITPTGSQDALAQRDEAAAERITAFAEEFPGAQIFALYGEMHLAAPHLPAIIRLRLRGHVLVVHQNEPSLYWRAPRRKNGDRPEVLRLRKDEYCLLTSVPWIKLRSYLEWAEGGGQEDWEDEADPAGAAAHFARHLAELLELDPPTEDILEIVAPDAFTRGMRLPAEASEKRLLAHSRERLRVSVLPSKRQLLLPAISTNALTEAGALLLWAQANHAARPGAIDARLLVQFLAGFLGSKLLNPKRKCNEEADMRRYLGRLSSARKISDPKAQVFTRALAILKLVLKNKRATGAALKGTKEIEAQRLAGYVLGNRLFLRWRSRKTSTRVVREVFTASVSSEKWAHHLLRQIREELEGEHRAPPAKADSF